MSWLVDSAAEGITSTFVGSKAKYLRPILNFSSSQFYTYVMRSRMMFKQLFWLLSASLPIVVSQNSSVAPTGVTLPLAARCGPANSTTIICIDRYASVMPYHFFRQPSHGSVDISFNDTQVPSDPSFQLVGDATFLVFDQSRAFEILGSAPTYDLLFHVSDAVHEAPVYVASVNLLYLSQLAPPTGKCMVETGQSNADMY